MSVIEYKCKVIHHTPRRFSPFVPRGIWVPGVTISGGRRKEDHRRIIHILSFFRNKNSFSSSLVSLFLVVNLNHMQVSTTTRLCYVVFVLVLLFLLFYFFLPERGGHFPAVVSINKSFNLHVTTITTIAQFVSFLAKTFLWFLTFFWKNLKN